MTEPAPGPAPVPNSELRAILAHGTGAADAGEVRRALGLETDTEDKLFARALVRALTLASLPSLPESIAERPRAAASWDEPNSVSVSRGFQMRTTEAVPSDSLTISKLDDLRTLRLVVRAGSLFQRREAVRRVGELLARDGSVPSELRKQAIEALVHMHPPDLAHEIGIALASLAGSEARSARAEQRTRAERAEQVLARIVAYWDGEDDHEPIAKLNAEERAQLLARLRELPELLARHVATLIEDPKSLGQEPRLRMLIGALEFTGDPRLLPALHSRLLAQDAETFDVCVRALSAIEDPRVAPILRDAYKPSARPRDRLVLAAALGRHGDARGLAYARETLSGGDPGLLALTLEVLAELGASEDLSRVAELLDHADPTVVHAAITTLGRIGDGRAIVPLAGLRGRAQSSALLAKIEDAEQAIYARVELLGEEAPSPQATSVVSDTNKMVARARARDPTLVRVRARLYHLFAYFWLVFGAPLRAIARFEAASALRPGWSAPLLALALLYSRRGQIPQALAAFRRAVDVDRDQIEGDGHAITTLAQTFLRRAEAMEQEGRLDIARSLVEEVLRYDLRRAAAEVRLALQERLELQVARERGWKP
jgi:tetratricopeptide (TPR) repeat protein